MKGERKSFVARRIFCAYIKTQPRTGDGGDRSVH